MNYDAITATVERLQNNATIAAWATGGILPRDPRRSGRNSTESVFDVDSMGDIKPTISVVSESSTRSISNLSNAEDMTLQLRIFAPDNADSTRSLFEVMTVIKSSLHHWRTDDKRFYISWQTTLGPLTNEWFEDVIYTELQFRAATLFDYQEV